MTGKEKVAMRVAYEVSGVVWATGEYLTPNWILDNIPGMKGATAERRLRELRMEYLQQFCISACWLGTTYGYRPSKTHENYWEYEKEFIEFLKDYVEQKKDCCGQDDKTTL